MNVYDRKFYESRQASTRTAAERILPLILERMPAVHSAVDVGCGAGEWLAVLSSLGVDEIQGVDGAWVDRELLDIPASAFTEVDLTQLPSLDRRYDLAISLEVAEHLPPERAGSFVELLAGAADFVLFSAAIPHQGGTAHVNEQWQHYWADLFRSVDFVPIDFVRPLIWSDAQIPVFYRQNIIFYARAERLGEISVRADAGPREGEALLSLVHPSVYAAAIAETLSVKSTFGLLRRALAVWARKTRRGGEG